MADDPRLGEGCGHASVPIRECAVCSERGVMRDVDMQGRVVTLCQPHARMAEKLNEVLDRMAEEGF